MVTPIPSLPNTSSAVNIQIISPMNFPNGATIPGLSNNGQPFGQPGADSFQRAGQPGAFGSNPQQALQDAYQQALNARNNAEQARNNYLNLANQLNGQAYQNQFSQGFGQPQANPFGQPQQGFGQPPVPGMPNPMDPMAQWQQQQLQQQLQQQQMQQMQQLQQQQWQQQQQQAQQQAEQQAQQAQQQQQQPPQQQQPQGLSNVPVEELNRMIAQPQTLQEKVDAMEEIGVRGQGTPETFELLKQEALSDTSQLPPGQAQDDANYIRQAALWTMGMLNKAQNSQVPTQSLPGLTAIEQIINNKNENPDVKAAAVQALQVINRPTDKRVAGILKRASKDKNPDVKRLAQEALAGKAIPLPGAAGQGGSPMFSGRVLS